ncbi:MAG TPA: bifunctional UDP-N-acetylglucosamine diphosphorylase/glucosamine-1-phosphate N-acetyltransferase GlmU [Bryobacteraceae bacterium]|jgi:bifunctional UDP-N-acetylglucosamine pyrophosphorylase/glucosamine-1-phosphate N-acetyltransferase|nr:bifunctional UDP-N-acetylglucosamine diphosphorylase/glucosamine-1-phosphate N-acetyltransferase GlmU [Bryobacteraceae bacterium]
MPESLSVVILAAGLGTRMKSRKAKVLHRAAGKPLVQHVIDTAALLTPPERIFVVVGHQAEEVRRAVETPGVRFIEQREQKGTGHAVTCGRDVLSGLEGHLIVLYGDGPLLRAETLRRLYEQERGSDAAGVLLTAIMDDPTGYGRVIRGADGRVLRIVEQKAATPDELAIREANMGIYCFRSELFWKHAGEMRPDNPACEYYLTDMAEILTRAGHRVDAMPIGDAREALGINTRLELAEVDRLLRERKLRELMLAGVTIEKPETVSIDADVAIGMDTVIEPFVQIRGRSVIGENCHIGAGAIIENSELADEVEVGPYTIIGSSRLERGVHAGPFARLRMENHVEAGAHIGNFVELKKTRMRAGAKANHLAYLGDSDIGARVNIGAGTITCNYDGFHKHPTHIGEGAFVGSNSTLVAPIEIGAGAYVGAGSVITQPVPPDALGLGRAHQVIKDEWAAKRRALGKGNAAK